jgi:hypothetical protein
MWAALFQQRLEIKTFSPLIALLKYDFGGNIFSGI